jgi:drug/metabolite transporter (DMT)-like permease
VRPSGEPRAEPPVGRRRWSRRRHRLLRWLGAAAVVLGVAAVLLPAQYGITAAFLAGLCGFLLAAALVVFFAVPGPGTLGVLLRSPSLGGAVLVVCVLLVLSTRGQSLQWLWWAGTAAAAGWTASALWRARRPGE